MSRDVLLKIMHEMKTTMGGIYRRLDATEESHGNRNYLKWNTEEKKWKKWTEDQWIVEQLIKLYILNVYSLLYVSFTSIKLFKNVNYDQYLQECIVQSLNQGRLLNNLIHSSVHWHCPYKHQLN